MPLEVEVPEVFEGLFQPARYKVYYGGRGSGKSWSIARALVHLAHHTPLRVVCAREFQNSIEESVHKLLSDQIKMYNLPYTIQEYSIFNSIGSEFIFKGLSKNDAAGVKSLEGADICWVEEAQNVSEASWKNLTPTVRKDGSEIWVSFNPDVEDAPTYQRFVIRQPTNSIVKKVNWDDNPWFPAVLEQERLDMLRDDPVAYQNVWEGHPKTFSEGAYFRDEIESLEAAGRIGDVPYDPSRPVHTFWDLGGSSGKSDSTAIWFVQAMDGDSYNIIDYWEGNNMALTKVASDVIAGREYNYSKHIIPHDGAHGNRQTGKTDQEILKAMELKVEVQDRTKDKDKDINNIRLVLPKCRFDREKCKTGLAALKNYRQEKDAKTGLWSFKHDWTSHGTDAFRYFSVGKDSIRIGTYNPNWRTGSSPAYTR